MLAHALIVAVVVASPGDVVEYERAADEWLAATSGVEARAFDEFVPGLWRDSGCLTPAEPVILELDTGTITISASHWFFGAICPLYDYSSFQTSLGVMHGSEEDSTLRLAFEPPVNAFYGFYSWLRGNGETGENNRMTLFDPEGVIIDALVGPISENEGWAFGHGFVSDVPVGRIEITSNTINSVTFLGVQGVLAPGEPSLGTVRIPGYRGPGDSDVIQLDFGVEFASGAPLGACCLPDGSCARRSEAVCGDIGGIFQGEATDCADFNGNGIADVCETCRSDSNDDGVVDFVDLLTLLHDWGPCP